MKYQIGVAMLEMMTSEPWTYFKFHQHFAKASNQACCMLGLKMATFTCLDEVTVP